MQNTVYSLMHFKNFQTEMQLLDSLKKLTWLAYT